MKNLKFVAAAVLTIATSGSVFAQNTYFELSSSTPGFGGYIELDAPSGSWSGPVINPTLSIQANAFVVVPIVSYDIKTPDQDFVSGAPGISFSALGDPTLVWGGGEISTIDLEINDADPASIDIFGGQPLDINFDLTFNNLNGSGTVDATGSLLVPDQGATWLMLGVALGMLGGVQVIQRRRLKVS